MPAAARMATRYRVAPSAKQPLDAPRGKHRAADRRARHAAGIVGADIENHGMGHAVRADDSPDHQAAQRNVGRPDRSADEGRDREMPDREVVRIGEQRDRDGRRQQGERVQQQDDAALQQVRRRADECSEQRHAEGPAASSAS